MTEAPGGTSIIPSVWVDEIEPVRDFYIEKLGFSHMMGVVGAGRKTGHGDRPEGRRQ